MPHTSRRSVLAVGGSFAVAGCLTGTDASKETTDTPRETADTPGEPTDTPRETATAPPTPAADYRYAELSEAEQAVIDALRDGTVTGGIDELPELFFETGQFTVRVDDAVYRVVVMSDGLTADYAWETDPVRAEDVSDEEIVAYESLSADERALFRAALEGREYDERPSSLPDYVRYDGTTYRVLLVVADIPKREISMYRVSSDDE